MRWLALVAVTLALVVAPPALAERFPDRPVKLVVGFAPGGQSTVLGHLLAEQFNAQWREPLVLDYRAGAGGTIAADHVAKSRPDGHTLLLATSANLPVAQALMPDLPYDALRDFAFVGGVVCSVYALAVNPTVPAKTLSEFVAYARAHPGRLNFASTGNSTVSYLGAQILASAAGVELVHIPYKGTAAALADVVAGHVQMMVAELPQIMPLAAAGSIRVLAVTSEKRTAFAPDVPTAAEQGYPGIVVDSWNAIVVPASTPADTVAQLRRALIAALANPGVARRLDELGFEVIDNARVDMRAVLRKDIERYTAIVKRTAGAAPR
jgi:tripartite-type tricarboxylate transporter receptor subunit TctC